MADRRRADRDGASDPDERGLAEDDEWAVPTEDRLRRARRPERLPDLLDDLVQRRGWSERLRSTVVFNRWEQIAGPELCRRCEPVRFAGGVLVVRAENQSWAAQVRYLGATVRRRASEVLGEPVQRLEVEIGALQGTVDSLDE